MSHAQWTAEHQEERLSNVVRKKLGRPTVQYPDPKTNPGMLKYDNKRPLAALFYFTPTILPLVLKSPDTYIHIGVNIFLVVLNRVSAMHYGKPSLPPLPWSAAGIPAGLLTFFLVFFSVTTYNRFNKMYGHCMALGGRTLEIAALVKTHIKDKESQWNIVRYILASIILHYEGMDGGAVDAEEWEKLKARQLLTVNEWHEAQKVGGLHYYYMHCLAITHLREVWQLEKGHLDKGYYRIEAYIVDLRRDSAGIANDIANPIPFPYYHILLVMMAVTYTVISFAFATMNTYMTIPAFCIVIVVMTGMREVAACLADPFGDDVTDFPLDIFINKAIKGVKTIMGFDISYALITQVSPQVDPNSVDVKLEEPKPSMAQAKSTIIDPSKSTL